MEHDNQPHTYAVMMRQNFIGWESSLSLLTHPATCTQENLVVPPLYTLGVWESVKFHLLGYEIHGLEKIPNKGAALIVYYHGAIPIDYYYFLAKVIIQKGRTCHSVADHFLFKLPGFKLLLEVFSVMHGPQEECARALKNGHLLAISPGGVREALFSDETYTLIWGNRKGFAQVAIDAKVPIIPMFTQNIREGFRSLGSIKFFRWLYEKFRLPIVPVYGGFPVKFRTYLGDPIPYDPNLTATELTEKVKEGVQALINRHQKIPGNILRALLERFHRRQKDD
ncbi:TMM68 protein, partial [Polypterus senegalus]